tara:strand:+ start:3276 stop:3563 length:288 start_codon:yes stop_codon:yes gene_type:complete
MNWTTNKNVPNGLILAIDPRGWDGACLFADQLTARESNVIQDRQTLKPRVRWSRSKRFGCWQWHTDLAEGLSNGIRTPHEEDDFFTARFVAKWLQ